MNGRCICGEVEIQIDNAPNRLYRCHCTLCQKQSGAGANAAFITAKENVKWVKGQDKITKYKKPTGFSSNFCSMCGSPVPNIIRRQPYYWVPAGLLEKASTFKVSVHLFTLDRAVWDNTALEGHVFETMPSLEELVELLHEPTST